MTDLGTNEPELLKTICCRFMVLKNIAVFLQPGCYDKAGLFLAVMACAEDLSVHSENLQHHTPPSPYLSECQCCKIYTRILQCFYYKEVRFVSATRYTLIYYDAFTTKKSDFSVIKIYAMMQLRSCKKKKSGLSTRSLLWCH